MSIEYESEAQRANRGVVLKAVAEDGRNFEFASDSLRADPELALIALETDWHVLQFASRELLSSREFMMRAVAIDGRALRCGGFKNDREVVFAAVANFGSVIGHLSDAMRDDYEVVITAVENEPIALRFASNRLKNNYAIVTKAVVRKFFVHAFASKEIQTSDFMEKIKTRSRGKGLWYILKLKWMMRNFVAWRFGNAVAAHDAAHFAPDGKAVMAAPGAQEAKRKFEEMGL